jgi:hypothetical protein
MSKRQQAGVEERPERVVTGGFLQPCRGAPPINAVACHRKFKMPQMHADLMRPSRVQLQFHQGGASPSLQDAIAGAGRASVPAADGHALAMGRVARDWRVDVAAQARHSPAGHGQINLLDIAAGELRGEMKMGGVVLGRHQATAGIFVQTMNNAGPRDPANAAELPAAVMEQGVDQRVLPVARGRMHHPSRRLVEHQQVVVFVEDVQRQVLGLGERGARLRALEDDGFARARVMRRFDDFPLDTDVAFGQEPLNGAAREAGQLAAQKDIQPLPGKGFVNNKNFGGGVVQGTEAGLEAARPLVISCSCFQERRINRPTPTQMALSAMLKAGKPSSAPPRR